MPSKSKAQARFMGAAAHNPAFAKKVGIPVSVAKEFNKADTGRKFREGGTMKDADLAQDKKMVKRAVSMHDKQLHGGKKTDLAGLKKGGMLAEKIRNEKSEIKRVGAKERDAKFEMKRVKSEEAVDKMKMGMCGGGKVKKMARGGGVEIKGKTKGTMIKMKGC